MTFAAAPTVTRRRVRARAIAVPVADVRREPGATSEQVTQALLGAPARVLETAANGWARVRLADYEGWVEERALGAAPRACETVAVIATPRAPLYAHATGSARIGEVFATSVLPVILAGQRSVAGRAPVWLPGSRRGWLDSADITERAADDPFPMRGTEMALALARALMGTPYLWGGVSALGIDCSGLSQLACRAGGVIIPRDADQQYAALPYVVDRASLRAGDLVYFAKGGAITHVGVALDSMMTLHASGHGESVIISSLDPATDEYSATLAGMYAGARRPFPDEPRAEAAR